MASGRSYRSSLVGRGAAGHLRMISDQLKESDKVAPGAAGDLQTDYAMVDRLVEAVTELKNSTSSTANWHAYR